MNKSTRTVDFDFAQPTDGSRVERSRWRSLSARRQLVNGGTFFLGNHLKTMALFQCAHLCQIVDDRMRVATVLFLKTTIGSNIS
jgi:hypothetical protein